MFIRREISAFLSERMMTGKVIVVYGSSGVFSKAFRGAYPEAALQCVTPSDYVTCLLPRGSLVSSAP